MKTYWLWPVVVFGCAAASCAEDDERSVGGDGEGSQAPFVPIEIPAIETRATVVAEEVVVLPPAAIGSYDGSGLILVDDTVLDEGSVVVSLDGAGLALRVVGVESDNGEPRYLTEPAALTDIFEELTVAGTIGLSDAGAVVLDEGPRAKSHIPGGVGLEITVPFAQTLLSDAELGSLTVNGEARVAAGFQYGWDIGVFRVNLFYFIPWFEAEVEAVFDGDLAVFFSGHSVELFRREFAPIDIPVGAPFPLRIVPVLTVSTVIDGTIEGDAAIETSFGLEAEGGAIYFAETGWSFPASAQRIANLSVEGELYADTVIVPVRARMEFLIYGATGVYVAADVPAIEVDASLSASPVSGELRAVGRFRLGGGFVPGVFDRVIPQWTNDRIYESEPYTIIDAQFGDDSGGGDATAVGGTIDCEYQRDFTEPGLVDEPYNDSYSVTLGMDDGGFASIPIHDQYGRPYHFVGRGRSGQEESFEIELVAGLVNVTYTLEFGATDRDSGSVRVFQSWSGAMEAEAESTFFWMQEGSTWTTVFEGTFSEVRDGRVWLRQSTRCDATFR